MDNTKLLLAMVSEYADLMNGSNKPSVREAIQLSPGLESKALNILDVKNPLDSPDFNATEYINRLFPNGK